MFVISITLWRSMLLVAAIRVLGKMKEKNCQLLSSLNAIQVLLSCCCFFVFCDNRVCSLFVWEDMTGKCKKKKRTAVTYVSIKRSCDRDFCIWWHFLSPAVSGFLVNMLYHQLAGIRSVAALNKSSRYRHSLTLDWQRPGHSGLVSGNCSGWCTPPPSCVGAGRKGGWLMIG